MLVTPEKADVGVSGLDGELVLDSSGDLDRVEVESEVELEVSVPVGVVGAVPGLVLADVLPRPRTGLPLPLLPARESRFVFLVRWALV